MEPCGDFEELGDNESRTLAEDEGDTERDARLDGDSRDADGDCVNEVDDVGDAVFFRCDGVSVAREAKGDTDILAVTLTETDTRGDLEDETDTLGDDEYERTADEDTVRDAPPLLVSHAVLDRVGETDADTDAVGLRLMVKVRSAVYEFDGDSESVGLADRETSRELDDCTDSVGDALEERDDVGVEEDVPSGDKDMEPVAYHERLSRPVDAADVDGDFEADLLSFSVRDSSALRLCDADVQADRATVPDPVMVPDRSVVSVDEALFDSAAEADSRGDVDREVVALSDADTIAVRAALPEILDVGDTDTLEERLEVTDAVVSGLVVAP